MVKGKKSRIFHGWSTVGRTRAGGHLIVVLAQTRKETCAIIESLLGQYGFDPKRCQKATITEGWGNQIRPNVKAEIRRAKKGGE